LELLELLAQQVLLGHLGVIPYLARLHQMVEVAAVQHHHKLAALEALEEAVVDIALLLVLVVLEILLQ
jgi:hypothetical protein